MVQLSDKTVLANFKVRRWGRWRHDKTAADQIHKNNGAERDAGNYNKRLLPLDATASIESAIGAARAYHIKMTMPWLDDGVRILPASVYMDYAAKMKELRQEFDTEVDAFLKDYNKHVKRAQGKLGKLFNENDYPQVKALKALYGFDLTILPFPSRDDFRVSSIPEDVKAGLDDRMQDVYKDAMQDVGKRIEDVVGRMVERLKGYKPGKDGKRAEGTFKDSLVNNVRELAELLPAFNLTGDKKLTKIIDKMRVELCKHDADLLRDDDKIRAKVATSADAVLTAVADFIA